MSVGGLARPVNPTCARQHPRPRARPAPAPSQPTGGLDWRPPGRSRTVVKPRGPPRPPVPRATTCKGLPWVPNLPGTLMDCLREREAGGHLQGSSAGDRRARKPALAAVLVGRRREAFADAGTRLGTELRKKTARGAIVWHAADGPKPNSSHLTPKEAQAQLRAAARARCGQAPDAARPSCANPCATRATSTSIQERRSTRSCAAASEQDDANASASSGVSERVPSPRWYDRSRSEAELSLLQVVTAAMFTKAGTLASWTPSIPVQLTEPGCPVRVYGFRVAAMTSLRKRPVARSRCLPGEDVTGGGGL
jgi:hypothetical protein